MWSRDPWEDPRLSIKRSARSKLLSQLILRCYSPFKLMSTHRRFPEATRCTHDYLKRLVKSSHPWYVWCWTLSIYFNQDNKQQHIEYRNGHEKPAIFYQPRLKRDLQKCETMSFFYVNLEFVHYNELNTYFTAFSILIFCLINVNMCNLYDRSSLGSSIIFRGVKWSRDQSLGVAALILSDSEALP